MRTSSTIASRVLTVLLGAVVAACARTPGTQPLPLGLLGAAPLDGTLRAAIPPAALRYEMRQRVPRPKLAFHSGGKVALWAANTNFNYLLGQDGTGRKTLTAIDLSKNSCYSPVALKVDHARNVWVGCELTSLSGTNGAVQEYSRAGALKKRYLPACPTPVSTCHSFSGYGYDSGLDSHGNVFASLNLYDIETCNPSCNDALSAGFEWWPKGNAAAHPRLISLGENCSPVCGVGFMDVDGSGNLWFTFTGYNHSTFGFGLGEVSNPTAKPTFTIVEPVGTYSSAAAVTLATPERA